MTIVQTIFIINLKTDIVHKFQALTPHRIYKKTR